MNNEQIVNRLSESRPIRRAAQLVSYVIHRSRQSIEDNVNKTQVISRFSQRLTQEFRNELYKAKEELKRKQR